VEKELNVDQKDWVDDLLGGRYCVDSSGEELNVDQKDWVDDLLGGRYCVDSSGERTQCRPEGLG
jgi:hypothetical protein